VGYAARQLSCGMQVQGLLHNPPLPHTLQDPPAVWMQQLQQNIACAGCRRLCAVGQVSEKVYVFCMGLGIPCHSRVLDTHVSQTSLSATNASKHLAHCCPLKPVAAVMGARGP
jgi:hypothetical protein